MRTRTPKSRVAIVAAFALLFGVGAPLIGSAPAGAGASVSVRAFGGAPSLGAPAGTLNAPVVDIAATHNGKGYWLLGQDGGIFNYGNARFYGSTGAMHLNQPVVGIAATRSGHGYWLVASDGGIFSFGDAHFYGSTGAMHLNQPIAGMATTPSGHGYWLVASDGGIFSFGDARFHGSTGNKVMFSSIVGMVSAPSGHGYWLVGAAGGVFTFGDAHPLPGVQPAAPLVGAQATAGGTGLLLVAGDGAVYAVGTAHYSGRVDAGLEQAVGIARAANGYWVATTPTGPPLPANSGSGRRIVYSNIQQRIWLVEASGQVSHSFLVSGRHGLPAVGTVHVYSKVPSSPSGNLTLPWTLRFSRASSGAPIDFHGIPIDPSGHAIEPDSLLGTPQSHGCVRMSQVDAKFVWDWSEVGTTVVVMDLGY